MAYQQIAADSPAVAELRLLLAAEIEGRRAAEKRCKVLAVIADSTTRALEALVAHMHIHESEGPSASPEGPLSPTSTTTDQET